MTKLRTAIVGAGKMGNIHAKVYSQLDQSEFIGVYDIDKTKAGQLAEKFNCRQFDSLEQMVGEVDAVTISAPTVAHLELATFFIENNIAIMIEKPLAVTSKQGKKIVNLAKKKNIVAAVGHSERCNPVVQAMKRLEIEPRFIEATRVSPYPFRSTDVGVVLDVMIHDIDIILALAQSKIVNVHASGVNVIAENEDICSARITFANECVANVTASRLALSTTRKFRIFSRQAYLSLDYLKKEGLVVKADKNIDVVKWIKERQNKGDFDFTTVNWPELLHIEQLEIEDKEPLKVEQESFLQSILDKDKRPEVTVAEGLAALECAEQILKSVRKKSWDSELGK